MASKKTPSRSRSELRRKQRRRRIASFSFLMIAAGTSPWWSEAVSEHLAHKMMTWNSHFRVEHVKVTGVRILTEDDVLELAKIPAGVSMFGLPFRTIEKRIEQDPWVRMASVHRRLPDTIELRVIERIPLAAVRGERLMVVTADSVAITPPSDNWVWDLPILSPPRRPKLDEGMRVHDQPTLVLLKQTAMARAASAELWKNISELYYSRNQIRAVINTPPAELIPGADASELNWAGLHQLLSQTGWDSTRSQTTIDMRIPGRVIIAEEDKENVEQAVG